MEEIRGVLKMVSPEKRLSSIQLTIETKELLKNLKAKGESYEEYIRKLLPKEALASIEEPKETPKETSPVNV